ncbi:hypothetical protein [Phenylobacterium sp.]|uniref:hypothetical protein n=1 Tax=Phenylobacterium sp. TaxID=1871053 RepID=UPI0035B3A609
MALGDGMNGAYYNTSGHNRAHASNAHAHRHFQLLAVLCMAAGALITQPADAALPQGQITLLCTGVEPVWNSGRRTDAPFEQRVIIDFDRRTFCLDTCEEHFPVSAITPDRIVLRNALEGGRHIDSIVVYREHETYRLESSYEAVMRWRKGPCNVVD